LYSFNCLSTGQFLISRCIGFPATSHILLIQDEME
jgi:hypothetical protein